MIALLLLAGWIGTLSAPGSASAARSVTGVFGQVGAGDGEFQTAGGVAVNQASGDVYVVDVEGQRIERFSAAGDFVGAFGGPGPGDGQFAFQSFADPFFAFSPPQIAVDQSDGSVYVADTGNDRIQKFSPVGVYDSQFGTPGEGDGELSSPQGVAVDPPSGDVYVADSGNNRVQRFISSGIYASQLGTPGSLAGQLLNPTRVGVDGAGEVFVLDAGNGRVQKFNPNGTFGGLFAPGTTPSDLTVDELNGRVYAAVSGGIVEFDLAGNALDTHGAGAGISASGLAVRATSGRIYAADGFNSRVFILDEVAAPTVAIEPVDAIEAESATFHGQVNPQGTSTSYYFEYTADGETWVPSPGFLRAPDTLGQEWVPLPVDAGAGTSDVAVNHSSDEATKNDAPVKLVPSTEYRVRLVASKPFASGSAVSDEVTFTTEPAAPRAQTRGAEVGATSAKLSGRVHPRHSPTTYVFEYGTDTSYGSSAPAGQLGDAGSGNDWSEVAEQITGLAPGTTYHYRVVATNQAGTAAGEDEAFKTAAAGAGSDGPQQRGLERVSPAGKDGLSVAGSASGEVAVDGERAYMRLTGASSDAASGNATPLLSERDPLTGWTGRAIDPPTPATGNGFRYEGLSDDMSEAVVSASSVLLIPEVPDTGETSLYLRDNADDTYRQMSVAAGQGDGFLLAGASGDFSNLVFETPVAQTGDMPQNDEVYPYLWNDGQVRALGVLPDGTPAPNGAIVGSSAERGSVQGAVARDGSRVVFHAVEPTLGAFGSRSSVAGQLYVRELEGPDAPRTLHVSGSQRDVLDPAAPLPATFWAAESAQTDRILFTSCEKLTNDATADSSGPSCTLGNPSTGVSGARLPGRDLYLYDVGSGELEDLTTADADGADVFGVVGASEDLGRIYFAAGGVLAPGGAIAGEPNLYLWDHGQISFVATLDYSPRAQYGDGRGGYIAPSGGSNWTLSTSKADNDGRMGSSRVSPDGNVAVFVARAPLTGYDNRNPQACPPVFDTPESGGGHPIANLEGRCLEVFRFDAVSGQLSCISCPADGTVAAGDSMLSSHPGRPGARARGSLTADGRSVFFQSPDVLAAGDSNGVDDVYEWRGGQTRLLSSGKGLFPSSFADATPDGRDALFITRDRLVASDGDDSLDLYDARVGGGFSDPEPAVECEGDECQEPPAGRPRLAEPGNDQSVGPGGSGGKVPFRLQRLTHSQLRALANGRKVALRVKVGGAGRVSVVGTARIGDRRLTVARGSKRAAEAGTVKIQLKLSKRAREQLARARKLSIRFLVRLAGSGARTTTVRLTKRPRSRTAGNGPKWRDS